MIICKNNAEMKEDGVQDILKNLGLLDKNLGLV